MIDEWEKIVGHDRMKMISNKYFNSRFDLEFPDLQEGNFKHKKLSIHSELENNANMLKEFEKNGLLTHNEVSRMIDVSTRNIINKSMPGAIFENVRKTLDDEILRTIKIGLIEIERKGLLTHDEVSRIIKVLSWNLADESMPGALFEYVRILLDNERFKDQGETKRLELVIRYIRESLVIEEEKLVNEEEKRLE